MNHHEETALDKIKKGFPFNKQTVGYFFLGIGFTMFLLNIITIVTFSSIQNIEIPLNGYYISVISSIILMTYSIYNIYDLN